MEEMKICISQTWEEWRGCEGAWLLCVLWGLGGWDYLFTSSPPSPQPPPRIHRVSIVLQGSSRHWRHSREERRWNSTLARLLSSGRILQMILASTPPTPTLLFWRIPSKQGTENSTWKKKVSILAVGEKKKWFLQIRNLWVSLPLPVITSRKTY